MGFVYVHTPIITSNDAEGAGEIFYLVTGKDNSLDDFYGKKSALLYLGNYMLKHSRKLTAMFTHLVQPLEQRHRTQVDMQVNFG